ncbi:MAG: 1-deoxy-D-xylulose-5-phosphate synthase N-terminal domain-containing protein [Patescibacteria group bacterium]
MNKKIDFEKLKSQAAEIRSMIIQRASVDSGHLASPLGAVEIIQAILEVFDFKKDKVVFDVGHQAHAYKILTGRKNRYFTMSKKNGLRAYPDIYESSFDFYGVGHTSTSVSAALGYAHRHPEYKSIAVLGDGSLTGGEAFEALNHAGQLQSNILVIYNDNGMSLGENVGALHDKQNLKNFAESLNFEYIGIVDGHDTEKIISVLEVIKKKKNPVFLHVTTTKGKGYKPAQLDPSSFHWPAPFDIATGKSIRLSSGDNWFKHSFKKGIEYIKKYKKVYFTTPAFIGWGLSEIHKLYPEKVIDTGISEQHCVTFSSALALNGNKVFCYISSNFLSRAFDQIIDVCLQRIPMVFVITFPGISDGGYTHQGIYTFPMLNMLPEAVIIHPVSLREYDRLLDIAISSKKTVFIQTPEENIDIQSFTGSMTSIKNGAKLTILPLGNMMGKAIRVANQIGDVQVLYTPFIKPFDTKSLGRYVRKTKRLLILEDGFVRGGVGQGIIDDMRLHGIDFEYQILGVKDKFPEQGTLDDVYEHVGLDDKHIANCARNLIKKSIMRYEKK